MRLAKWEAERLDSRTFGTEHILLGLVKVGGGVAADTMSELGVPLHAIANEIERCKQSGEVGQSLRAVPRKPRAKHVMEYAIDESKQLNDDSVGTEHILLGLLRQDEGFAAHVLRRTRFAAGAGASGD